MFVALVVVNAAIGIGVVLTGGLGPTGERVLATSFATTGGVVLAISCVAGRRSRWLGRAWTVGVAAAAAATTLLVAGVWSEPESGPYWRLTGSLAVVAGAVGLVSIAGLGRVRRRHEWIHGAIAATTAALAAMAIVAIWTTLEATWFWRGFGALAVALAAQLLVLPVVHEGPTALGGGPRPGTDYCPGCGRPLTAADGVEARCGACGGAFVVHRRGGV